MLDVHRETIAAVLLCAVIVLPGSASGSLMELHPNLAPGGQSNMYRFPDAPDEVNLFNGNLHLSIPIGQSYPVAENFRYQLVLHYNSNIWRRTQVSATTVRADPMPTSKAGLGWDLSLGRLWSPESNPTGQWIYVEPDGTRNAFYPTLHPGVAENDPGDVAQYTRNGAYLRLRSISSSERRVEFPDGSRKVFRSSGPYWLLSDHRNSSGKGYTLTYLNNLWEIRDDHGRAQRVYFKADTTGAFGGIVDRVEVTAFGGATAVYHLTYTNESFPRGCADNDPATGNASVPFLSSVTLPDGTQYRFSHRAGSSNCHEIGRISSVELPTLGRIDYFYGWHPFVQAGWGQPADCPTELPSALAFASGVYERRTHDANGAQLGAWSIYRYARRMYGGTGCTGPLDLVVDAYDPNGDLVRHFFNITSSSQSWERGTYGYPFTYTWDGAGKRLSTHSFDCDPGPRGVNCVLKRNRWVRYDHDAVVEPLVPTHLHANRREAEWLLEYLDDKLPSGAWASVSVQRRRFDGLGHYREVETNDNWGSAPAEILTTEYTAAKGDFPSATWTMPAPSAPWVLGVLSSQAQARSDGSEKLVREHCYNASTGLLGSTRTWSGAAGRGSNDLLETYLRDEWGNRVATRYYGGDTQAIPTTSACSTPSSGFQFATSSTFSSGVVSRSTSLDAAGNAVLPWEIDRDIDPNTGFVAAERDSAGLETTFLYDVSAQISAVMPEAGHGAWLLTTREPPSGLSGGAVVVEMVRNGGGAPYTVERHELDNFARVATQERSMPGGETTARRTEYDALGRIARFFDWGASSPTTVLVRDLFGRELHVRPPDGWEHDMTYVWRGDRVRETRGSAWYRRLGNDVEERSFAKTALFDRRGNVVKQTSHPMASPLLEHSTTHGYDLRGNRLWSALDGRRVGETRTYDRRGLLMRVEVPGGTAATTYSYNAWRLPSRVVADGQEVVNVYDAKGRLIRVEGTDGYLWKSFSFARENDAGNLQAGKLRQRIRNTKRWDGWGTASVTETFTYAGIGGRLSTMELAVSGQQGTLVTGIAHDEVGRVSTLDYPRCVGCKPETVRGTVMRSLSVDQFFDGGALTTLRTRDSSFGSRSTAINYHSNGLPSEIQYPNGARESWTADGSGRSRAVAVSIYRQNAGTFHYDDFHYDGTGRLVSVREGGGSYSKFHFFVPENRLEPEPIDPAPSINHPCHGQSGFRDPFGVSHGVGWNESCQPTMAIHVNAEDEPVFVEHLFENRVVWTGYGPGREILTEYETWRSTPWIWRSTTDYVYRDGLLHKEIVRNPEEGSTWTYYHSSHGAPGITTSGIW